MKIVKLYDITKKVRYLDESVNVPEYTVYLAINKNGELYAYPFIPHISAGESFWRDNSQEAVALGIVKDFGNWKKSLREVRVA